MDDGEVMVDKSHLSSLDFLRGEAYSWADGNMMQAAAIMGHTRYPTFQNTVQDRFAQPYRYSSTDGKRSVMATHNGHVGNFGMLTAKIPKFSHPVDSAHLTRALAEEANTKELLRSIRGGYALVWYDEERDSMYAAQNGARSLFMGFSKDKTKCYYASEEVDLRWALAKAHIDVEEIMDLPPFMCCKWSLGGDTLIPGVSFKYQEKTEIVSALPHHTTGGRGGPYSKKGGKIWVKVDEKGAFSPYRDKQNNPLERGSLYGSTSTDVGALVQIQSVVQADWERGDLQLIRNSIPCIVHDCIREDDLGNGKFNFYTVFLDQIEVGKEIEREKKALEIKKALLVDGPNASRITSLEWEAIAKEGCFHDTSHVILQVDRNNVGWQLIKTNLEGDKDLYQMVCPVCVHAIRNEIGRAHV